MLTPSPDLSPLGRGRGVTTDFAAGSLFPMKWGGTGEGGGLPRPCALERFLEGAGGEFQMVLPVEHVAVDEVGG